MKKLIVIDGNSLIYRAFFALPLLQTEGGRYTNGVYGFTTMLLKMLEDEKPDYMLVAFDKGKKNFRHDTYKEYKGHRPSTPDELREQFKTVKEMLELMNIKFYEAENYEADDIIGTVCEQAKGQKLKTTVVTGDKDILQLVDESVEVMLTRKGITNTERYDVEKFKEVYGINPAQFIDIKGLMGDSSDNIPGVPGVGEKTALKFIKKYKDIEGVYENVEECGGPKMREKLKANKDIAFISKDLATIFKEVPIDFKFEDLNIGIFDVKLKDMFMDLEFNSLLPKLNIETPQQQLKELEIKGNTNAKDLQNKKVAFWWTDSTIYVCDGKLVYKLEDEKQMNQFLCDESIDKICYDKKSVLHKASDIGCQPKELKFCSVIAAYLLKPEQKEYTMEFLSTNYIGNTAVCDEFPQNYSYALYNIAQNLKKELEEKKLWKLYLELELPLTEVLYTMERNGVNIDREHLTELKDEFSKRLADLEEKIYSYTDEKFNINSPKQLGKILFEELNLPVIKKTKTGYSTDVSVLEKLRTEHPIIEHLLQYRMVAKIKSTYLEGMEGLIGKNDGKIHTHFNQTITATGRLSSTEPNLQNIPIRVEEGRKVRKIFVPHQKDNILVSLDYSQIELRIMAHMSQDSVMIDGFKKEQDIHTRTAAEVYGVDLEEVTYEQRRNAKAVNFGIVYGISDYGLSQNLGISRKQAKEYIDRYFERYVGVKSFIEETVEKAKEKGYVTTLFNRRRYIPEINSRSFHRRSFAERTAVNTPIQGTAADIIKKAMVDIHKANLACDMLLQVHDDLVFEIDKSKADQVIPQIRTLMEGTIKLDVALTVDVNKGNNWYNME
ncbi:DNA polymerase I [Proteinivorax tanatarense]|uniref:DNA polymerase I n=1 Tax=Proteinivorax tanatarense TaxID=1260629 RepID=A0AAU7VP88_9FIRM